MAAVIWVAAWRRGAPLQARLLMMGLLLVAVLMTHVILPDGHPVRVATGREPGPWLLLVVLVALAWGYRQFLLGLRRRADTAHADRTAEAAPEPTARSPLSETELNRYARHIALREVGGLGQRRLREARVLVVGAGGLGSPALLYLAGAGVGTIGVIDDDQVEGSNLQRQVIHRDADIGRPKVQSAADAIAALNPFVTVRPYGRRLTEEVAAALFADYDLVLDGSDNWETRALVNRAAVEAGVPLLSGAIAQWEGQLSLFDPAGGAPCLACVFPEAPRPGLAPSCAEAGVVGPLPGVVGSWMALEAVKEIVGAGEGLAGRLLLIDGLDAEVRAVRVERRPGCPVCAGVTPR
jgi:molybdopterin/thiamine biosynthesis adenylyltransferase